MIVIVQLIIQDSLLGRSANIRLRHVINHQHLHTPYRTFQSTISWSATIFNSCLSVIPPLQTAICKLRNVWNRITIVTWDVVTWDYIKTISDCGMCKGWKIIERKTFWRVAQWWWKNNSVRRVLEWQSSPGMRSVTWDVCIETTYDCILCEGWKIERYDICKKMFEAWRSVWEKGMQSSPEMWSFTWDVYIEIVYCVRAERSNVTGRRGVKIHGLH